jgi:hypothetical protein
LWAFICPFVAYAVLGTFVYNLFIPTAILKTVILASFATGIVFYILIAIRYFKYRNPETITLTTTEKKLA